jgi:hypothetical protein
VSEDGKERKYDQPVGTGCRLYVLEPVVDLLPDYTKPIFIVEGEKKSAAGYQAGLGCVVGVGGIWNFLNKDTGELIPEFDRIAWRNREIYYLPDSDVWARRDLQQAVYEFGVKIRERGGLWLSCIQLSPAPNGKKRGLDDFLLSEDVDTLMKLPKVTLNGPGWILEKQAHKAKTAKRQKPGKQASTDISEEKNPDEVPQELLSKAWSTHDLITKIVNTIRRFVFIRDDRLYLLIAIWTIATYIYECFDYMPLLWVNSPTKRSGKTRLLEVLAQLVSRSSGLLINPSESILFHNTDKGVTLFLDEVEKLQQKNSDLYGAVMAILNSGFQKGATVSRMRHDKDRDFREVRYRTYGPKVIAGIKSVTDTIEDRSLVIRMVRRVRSTEKVERFRLRTLTAELGGIVLQLKIWAAAKSSVIQKIYDNMQSEPEALKGCDDRFLDIVEPLLAIAAHADAEYANSGRRIFDDLVALLHDLGEDREETQSEAAIASSVEIIGSVLADDNERFIPSTDMLKKFQAHPATAWIKSTKSLATFLSKLGLRPKPDAQGKKRGYFLSRRWYTEMAERYSNCALEISETSDMSESPSDQQVEDEKRTVREEDFDAPRMI